MPIPHNVPLGPPIVNEFSKRPIVNSQAVNRTYWTKHQKVLEDGSVELDGNEIVKPNSTLHIPKTYRLIYSYPGEVEYNDDVERPYISGSETKCGCPHTCNWQTNSESNRLQVEVFNNPSFYVVQGNPGSFPLTHVGGLYTFPPSSLSVNNDYTTLLAAPVSIWVWKYTTPVPNILIYDPASYIKILSTTIANLPNPIVNPLTGATQTVKKTYVKSIFWVLKCSDGAIVGSDSKVRGAVNVDASFYSLRCPDDYPDYHQPCVDPANDPCGRG